MAARRLYRPALARPAKRLTRAAPLALPRYFLVYRADLHLPGTRLVYIGRTGKTLDARRGEHLRKAQQGSPYPLHRALRLYPATAWTWRVMWRGVSRHESMLEETKWIRKLRRSALAGGGRGTVMVLNVTDGGYEERRRYK